VPLPSDEPAGDPISHIDVMLKRTGVGLVALGLVGCTSTTHPSAKTPVVSFHGITYPIQDGWSVRTSPVTCLAPAPSGDTIVVTDGVALPSCTQIKVPATFEQVWIHRWLTGVDQSLPPGAERVKWHDLDAYRTTITAGPPVQIALVVPKLKVEVLVSALAATDSEKLLNLARPQS
jgi:hypothetical protein